MNAVDTLTDQEFLDAFLEARLLPGDFDHRGHLRAAWLVLREHPLDEAVERICNGIRGLATSFGAPEKFNRTLTEAIVRLMLQADSAPLTWTEFLSANPELLKDLPGVLARHYSPQLLSSATAKATFIPPDRLPLPPCPPSTPNH